MSHPKIAASLLALLATVTPTASVIARECKDIEPVEYSEELSDEELAGHSFTHLKLGRTSFSTDNYSFTTFQSRYLFRVPKSGTYKVAATVAVSVNPFGGGDGCYAQAGKECAIQAKEGEQITIQLSGLTTCTKRFSISIWE